VAETAETALELAATFNPKYAVVDLKLPGDSGLTVVSGLKASFPGTRTVVLTGFASIATAV
jgi:two-component system response regulator RegA